MKTAATLLLTGTLAAALTGCSSGANKTATGSNAPAVATSATVAATSTPSAADTTDSDYILGQAASARQPYPNCSLAVAGWTASSGPVVVQIFGTPGPTTITITIAKKAGSESVQTAMIQAGQTAHDFHFPEVDPSTVGTVLVTATDGDTGLGGSCYATGGPTA